MKTINEIINDLIEFAKTNGVIGDGKIDIKIGDFEIHKSISVDVVPTVEKVTKDASISKAEAARRRFMGCGLVEDTDDTSFDKVFNSDIDDNFIKNAIEDANNVEV